MKGFGFVQRDDGGEDVFVHISALERSGMGQVTQGDRLAFDIEIDRRGKFSATNLASRLCINSTQPSRKSLRRVPPLRRR